jgi:hypothetical protein
MKVRPANLASRPHKILPVILFSLFAFPLPTHAQYQSMPVPNGGVISGTVKWSGERPKPLVLPISKDGAVCDPQKTGTRDLDRIVINSDAEVENTVVYLKNVTHGKPWDPASMHQVLDQKTCRYVPHVIVVPAAAQFGMKSSDPILHTIHMIGAESYNLPFPMTDVVVSRPLRNAGLIDLKCNAGHFWMNATILVVDHPYYAITDSHGEFRLTGVPPGDYEIVAWHEGWKVEHEEQVLDVGTQTKTKRYFFSDPVTWEKKVTVAPEGHSTIDFTLSEK